MNIIAQAISTYTVHPLEIELLKLPRRLYLLDFLGSSLPLYTAKFSVHQSVRIKIKYSDEVTKRRSDEVCDEVCHEVCDEVSLCFDQLDSSMF
jgi:hypothetical protein